MNPEIIKKFAIEKLDKKLILNKPEDIMDFDGISFSTTIGNKKYDLIWAFIFSLDEFTNLVKTVIEKNLLNPNGMLYFAYPKKGNKQYKEYIGRDDFFPSIDMDNDGYVFNSPIKFNKMAAFNEVFTVIGLKHEEKRKKSVQPSQCVGDYVERIPELTKYFAENEEVLIRFNQLTSGYQRDWARYVFGVKNSATTEKRFAEMENILKQGYKSVDLYRRGKNPKSPKGDLSPDLPLQGAGG
jgi:hypothetical protein